MANSLPSSDSSSKTISEPSEIATSSLVPQSTLLFYSSDLNSIPMPTTYENFQDQKGSPAELPNADHVPSPSSLSAIPTPTASVDHTETNISIIEEIKEIMASAIADQSVIPITDSKESRNTVTPTLSAPFFVQSTQNITNHNSESAAMSTQSLSSSSSSPVVNDEQVMDPQEEEAYRALREAVEGLMGTLAGSCHSMETVAAAAAAAVDLLRSSSELGEASYPVESVTVIDHESAGNGLSTTLESPIGATADTSKRDEQALVQCVSSEIDSARKKRKSEPKNDKRNGGSKKRKQKSTNQLQSSSNFSLLSVEHTSQSNHERLVLDDLPATESCKFLPVVDIGEDEKAAESRKVRGQHICEFCGKIFSRS
jgi:hypothetical protein